MCKTKSFTTKKKKVRQVEESEDEAELNPKDNDRVHSDSDESDAYHIFATALVTKPKREMYGKSDMLAVKEDKYNSKITCVVGGVPLEWLVDYGASVNVIDEHTLKILKNRGCKISCESVDAKQKLVAYGDHRLEVKGVFKTDITHGVTTVHREVYVIKGQGTNLLGKTTSIDLGVLRIKSDVLEITEQV